MIRFKYQRIQSIDDAYRLIQMAVQVEFSTLPPYLYALYTIRRGTNPAASSRLLGIVHQEMIHMCLACNLMNALGRSPTLSAPTYPGPLPGDIGSDKGKTFDVHLLPFSRESMAQGMKIEEPEDGGIVFPELLEGVEPEFMTIGQFYAALDAYLATLPRSAWQAGRNQFDGAQFFAGQLFAINDYADAHRAIQQIVSEGEGSKDSPLDFQNELAHFYRFEEIWRDEVLVRADNPKGFAWSKQPLGVDWKAVYPAIPDPGTHDFSGDPPAARAAQDACNAAFTRMVDELQRAIAGEQARLGNAVRAMFDLRTATHEALVAPLADGVAVAGPAFLYAPLLLQRSAS
jgi:hypothetical protein